MRTSQVEAEFSVLQFLQVREALSCQQGDAGSWAEWRRANNGSRHTWAGGGADEVWRDTDIPQGNGDLALHSTNKTTQTMLMKCLGSCSLVNSNLFCFFCFF